MIQFVVGEKNVYKWHRVRKRCNKIWQPVTVTEDKFLQSWGSNWKWWQVNKFWYSQRYCITFWSLFSKDICQWIPHTRYIDPIYWQLFAYTDRLSLLGGLGYTPQTICSKCFPKCLFVCLGFFVILNNFSVIWWWSVFIGRRENLHTLYNVFEKRPPAFW
jgi:hypothetical protein